MIKTQSSKRRMDKSKITFPTLILIVIGMLVGFFTALSIRGAVLSCTSICCHDILYAQRFRSSRAYESESNIRIYQEIPLEKSLVFVGVMTAQKYLDTRARSVYETWGNKIPGLMSFFSRSGSTSKYDLPLVSLPGVDDSYPPQKKSFMMLKFIHDHYLHKFEWFMRVDDDVYIKPDRIEPFLRSLNSSTPQFIGQAGVGNKEEFGLLSLNYDENFCMGGPGIVMSRRTLELLVPHISFCLKNLLSTHEDVEIGRCVRRFVNISCTWSYEMQHIFHHNFSGNAAFTGDLLSREVLRATSLHPIKQPQFLYRLHNFLNSRRIMDLRQQAMQLKRDSFALKLELLNRTSPSRITDDSSNIEIYSEFENLILNKNSDMSINHIANRHCLKPSLGVGATSSRQGIDFEFFTRSLFSASYISPKRGLEGYWKRSLADTIRQLMDDINVNSKERGRIIDFKDLLYGYVRHHPLFGLDYILDVLLIYRKYEGRKMTLPVRRHAYLRRSFSTILFREDDSTSSLNTNLEDDAATISDKSSRQQMMPKFSSPNYDESFGISKQVSTKTINFIVPIAGRMEKLKSFLTNYERVCIESNENAKLVIVLFELDTIIYDSESRKYSKQSLVINKLIRYYNQKYSNILNEDSIRLIVTKSNFSRSIGCELGARIFEPDDLLFFVDVDIEFNHDFMLRARLNTIQSKQVYYPIVFSEYDPSYLDDTNEQEGQESTSRSHFDFNMDSGYWRQFGFGIVCIYNSDLRQVGGFDMRIVGWGKEDVDLYEKMIRSNLTVWRSVDPGLVHVFHRIVCDPTLADEQMIMCIGSKATSIASQRRLARLIYNRKRAF